jgi:hypothetical protein
LKKRSVEEKIFSTVLKERIPPTLLPPLSIHGEGRKEEEEDEE